MNLNEIRDNPGASVPRKRIGRGIGSGSGKTAGRGHKGQKSRSGVSLLGFEGGQMPLYRRLPKRGFKNPFSKRYAELNIGKLQSAVNAEKIDPTKPITEALLRGAGLVRKSRDGVRLLGKGEITAKLEIIISSATKSAINSVEKVGGKVSLPIPPEKIEGKGKRRDKLSAERKAAHAVEQGS